MLPPALVRRVVYVALGALPATYCSFLLVQAWPAYLAPNPYQTLPVRIYFACLPAFALTGCVALWVLTLSASPISFHWLRRLVLFGVLVGVVVTLPWALLFLPGLLLVIGSHLHVTVGASDTFHGPGALVLPWIIYGPFLVGIHAIVTKFRGASSI
jgi:hypothetical protein